MLFSNAYNTSVDKQPFRCHTTLSFCVFFCVITHYTFLQPNKNQSIKHDMSRKARNIPGVS